MTQPAPPDPNLAYTDPAEFHRQSLAYSQAMNAAQMQSFAAPILAQNATMARNEARRDAERADVWAEYSGEIDAAMANVPIEQRTIDAWNMAADIVAGRHRKELATKMADRFVAERSDTGTISASGGLPIGGRQASGDALDELFQSDHPSVARMKALGKTADDVARTASAMGHTRESYANLLRGSSVVVYNERGTPKTLTEAQHAATGV